MFFLTILQLMGTGVISRVSRAAKNILVQVLTRAPVLLGAYREWNGSCAPSSAVVGLGVVYPMDDFLEAESGRWINQKRDHSQGRCHGCLVSRSGRPAPGI